MMSTRVSWIGTAVVALIVAGSSVASDIGHEAASRVDVANYRHYLDDLLYTHDGHNRGRLGPEHDLARANIVATFESHGFEVELHAFDYEGGTYYNVVATRPGFIDPDAQYIIGAHYDSKDNPGADDNASGVAALMELARVFSHYRTAYTVRLIAFDLEELGLLGSRAYVQDHLSDDIRGMISADMIAHDVEGYQTWIAGRVASNPFKTAVAEAMDEYGDGLVGVVRQALNVSDHVPFEAAGFLACVLIEYQYSSNPCYHRACDSVDTPDYIDYEFAADHVRTMAGFLADVAAAYRFGDLNCDGPFNGADIDPFFLAIGDPGTYAAQYPACEIMLGDMNGDGAVNGADIDVFFECLGSGVCP